jgi:hypothetical protein
MGGWDAPRREARNERIFRQYLESVACNACVGTRPQRGRSAVALAEDLFVRPVPARATLYARLRSEMARKARGRRWAMRTSTPQFGPVSLLNTSSGSIHDGVRRGSASRRCDRGSAGHAGPNRSRTHLGGDIGERLPEPRRSGSGHPVINTRRPALFRSIAFATG